MITSRQNQWVARVRKARGSRAEVVIEGAKHVREALRLGMSKIVILASASAGFAGEEAEIVSDEIVDWLSDTRTPQGVFGLFERPSSRLDDLLEGRRVSVALDGVQDPGNVGTIVRLASAFGASGVVILPGTADPWGSRAVRASAGAILSVPVVELAPPALVELADSEGLAFLAAEARGTRSEMPGRDLVLVLGSEGRGLSREVASRAELVSIGMESKADSINVGSAAAILLHASYHAARSSRTL